MARNRRTIWTASFICLLAGAAYCQGGGSSEPAGPRSEQTATSVDWVYAYQDGIERAKKESKPVLIDFYADWCNPCRMMDARVYTDPRVVKALQEFVCVKIDVVREEKIAFAYRIQSIPRTIVLNIFQENIGDRIGFLDSDEFIEFVNSTKVYALKKVGGLVVSVPNSSVVVPAQPRVYVTPDTDLSSLIDLLASKEPVVRQEAGQELLRRNSPETRKGLIEALASDYLGVRIAAWKAVRNMQADIGQEYDPWAPRNEREASLNRIRQMYDSRTGSGSD